jgi:hypothetical protein
VIAAMPMPMIQFGELRSSELRSGSGPNHQEIT